MLRYCLIIFAFILSINCKDRDMTIAPDAKKIPKELIEHGNKRIDNYYWMNNRDSKEVLDYIKLENDYTDAILSDTKDFQESLYTEITSRIKEKVESVPYLDNGYYYYSRFEEGKEYPLNCRKKWSLSADEEIILDENLLAGNYSYSAVGDISISESNELMAYTWDNVSRRKYEIHIRNLITNQELPDIIKSTDGSIEWSNDNQTLYYIRKDVETLREFQVFSHKLGDDPKNDKLIFEEKDEEYHLSITKSKSNKFIYIISSQSISTEIWTIDANDTEAKPKIIQKRKKGLEYSVYDYKDDFYIITNDKAQNFKIVSCKQNNPSKENWIEFIPTNKDILILDLEIFDNYFVVEQRRNGLVEFNLIDRNSNKQTIISMDEPVYNVSFGINLQFDTEILNYSYNSLTTPSSVFEVNLKTLEKTLIKEYEVLGGYNKNDYTSERLFAETSDGVKVPISLVYKQGTKLDGSSPLLLNGYGSYGVSNDVRFSIDRISLLDRGFIFAMAHIRGGEELGRDWYENGKLLKKKNTFTDFITVSEYLIKNNYTNCDKLFANGGSAGGLLMGAIYNMRPDLYKGVLAAVPFVDVVTTMLDSSIPLTTFEYDEWGNPNEKVYYDYMLSYSPYDNVAAKSYPNLLITTGYHDSQVQYWEPLKWIAKLRDYNTSDNIMLLHTQMEAGHGGTTGRFKRYKERALEYAFMFKMIGINK